MDAAAFIKIVSLAFDGFKLGQKVAPLLKEIADLAHAYEDPARDDVTLATLDQKLAEMRSRHAQIQDTSGE